MDPYIRDFQCHPMTTYHVEGFDDFHQVYKINNKNFSFKLLHQNIKSVNKNFDEFKVYMAELPSIMDCIVLSENWVVDYVDVFNLSVYRLIYNEGSFNKVDGLIVYVEKDLHGMLDTNKRKSEIYEVVGEANGVGSGCREEIKKIRWNNKEIKNTEQISGAFNEFFMGIRPNLAGRTKEK
ncbi:hypothetical protein HHI36_002852 [Cryptolaemus montrouzieri]|uniref:Uncharacterized protein n=1 Tax=Cryptolaemus montrouzieri TaxID=559131 RepID=A0ABD2PBS2_9CUCU